MGNQSKKKITAALVFVVCDRHERLRKNLSLLRTQKRHPDCVIIVNNGTESLEWVRNEIETGIRLIIIKTEGIGPAGGFKEGAKRAYMEGYDYIILADDDAYPADDNLIACLLEDAEGGRLAVGGYYTDGCIAGSSNHYFTLHRSVFSQAGFHFKPFFLMGEDLELQTRIARVAEVFFDKRAVIDHPWRITTDSVRAYYSARNSLVTKAIYGSLSTFLFIYLTHLIRSIFITVFLMKPAFLSAFIRSNVDFTLGRLGDRKLTGDRIETKEVPPEEVAGGGKAVFIAINLKNVEPPVEMDTVREGDYTKVFSEKTFFGVGQRMVNIMRSFDNKDIVLSSMFFLSWPPFSLLTRRVYWYDVLAKKIFLIYRNNAILSAVFLLLAAPFLILAFPVAGALYYLKKGHYKGLMEKEIADDLEFCKKADSRRE